MRHINLINYIGVLICTLILGACGGGGGGAAPAAGNETPPTPDASETPTWQGIKQLGSDMTEMTTDVASDSQGNIFVTGWTTGELDGNTSAGQQDIFLVKYDTAGNKRWTRQLGTTGVDKAMAIAIDSNDNVYITGSTDAALAGDGTHQGSSDIFVAQYANSGELENVWQIGSTANDQALDILLDANNELYITGNTSGDLAGPGSHTSLADYFIAKLDASGSLLWIDQHSFDFETCILGICSTTETADYANALALDPAGNINVVVSSVAIINQNTVVTYLPDGTRNGSIAVNFSSNIVIDTIGSIYVTGQYASTDVIVEKYQPDGTLLWYKIFGTTEIDYAQDIVIDRDDKFYITGSTYGSFEGFSNTSGTDIFVVKFDSEGTGIWKQQLGDDNTNDNATAITIDPTGHIVVAGKTRSDLGDNINVGGEDIFVLKYNTEGNLQ